MTIWIIKQSRDGGNTWGLHTPYHLYKDHDKATAAADKMNGWQGISRFKYKAVEFVEVSA